MTERKVLFKKACAYAQASDTVSVKQLMIVGENGKKYLALRLFNERDEAVSAVDLDITELDADGKIIARTTLDIDVSGGAGEVFVPDQKIELEADTCDCNVVVERAVFGSYAYRAVNGKAVVEYDGGEKREAPAVTEKTNYADKLGKDGIAIKPRKLKIPLLVVFAMIASLVFTAVAAYLHMLFFVSTETTFLHNGVEYAFEDGDSSPGTDIYVIGYYGGRSRIVVPEEIDGHKVTRIADGAFKNDSSLVSISFEGEIPVGDNAFENCISLKEAEFEKITSIGKGAFRACAMLKSVVIRSDISVVPEDAFYGCTQLSSVKFEQSAEPVVLGLRAFSDCKNLDTVEFLRRIDYGKNSRRGYFSGSSVNKLRLLNFDFTGNSNTDVFAALFDAQSLPENARVGELTVDYLTNIPDEFLRKVPLTSFTVKYADSTVVGAHAFDGCSELKRFEYPAPLTEIGDYAFFGTALTEFDGTALKTAGERAFGNCSKLAAVDFTGNNAMSDISVGMFENCTSLTRIVLPTNVAYITTRAFSGCSALYDVRIAGEGSVSGVSANSFEGCASLTRIPELGADFGYIGDSAFKGCTGLADIVVPDTVTYIGRSAFADCDTLKKLTVPFVGATVTGESGYLSHIFGARRSDDYGAVPASLKEVVVTKARAVYANAFYGLSGLTSVVLPDGVTDIYDAAFSGCSGLTEIKLPEKLTAIGQNAFMNCSGLTSIEFPAGLASIGQNAFSGCKALTELVVPNGVTEIGFGAFSGCENIKKMTLPYAVGQNGGYTYFGYILGAPDAEMASGYASDKLETIVISGGSRIPQNAFRGLRLVKEIVLPDTVTEIGNYAFYDCAALKTLTLPNGVLSVGYGILINTNSLESLSVPFVGASNYTGNLHYGPFSSRAAHFYSEYGDGSFMTPPRALKTVTLTNSDYIAPAAFSGFRYIERIVLDCDVAGIGDDAFTDCRRLYEVFNGSTALSFDAGSLGNGGIAENVLAVHSGADAEPLDTATTASGFRFVSANGAWHLIDYPIDAVGNPVAGLKLPVTVSANGFDFGSYRIRRYLFADTALKEIDIPDSVTHIGEYAFNNAFALTAVRFSARSQVTEIAPHTFEYDRMLAEVALPYGLRNIGESAFSFCSRIKKITIGRNVSEIGYNAFYGCGRLFEVYNQSALGIVKGASDYGYVAYNAREVYSGADIDDTEISLPTVISGGVQYVKLGDGGMDWWAVDYYGEDGVLELKPFAYDGGTVNRIDIYDGAFDNNGDIVKAVIGNVVERIDAQFDTCYNLAEVEIVNNGGAYSAMSIGADAFNVYVLRSVRVGVDISNIESGAFRLYNLTDIEFTGYVGTIKSQAFVDMGGMPFTAAFADVGTIETEAFRDVNSLSSFKAGNADDIAARAFYSCDNLESVAFGKVGSIGDGAFSNCYSLRTASFGNVATVGASAFANDYELKTFTVAGGNGDSLTVGARAFEQCSSLSAFEYGGHIDIGDYAFYSCGSLSALKLNTAGAVGSRAFYNCGGLVSAEFNGDVDAIKSNAFNNDYSLSSVVFGGRVGTVDNYAFSSCGALRRVEFKGDVGTIGDGAFSSSGLETLEFGGNLEALGRRAFSTCTNLKKAALPASLASIPDYAFENCYGLREVHLPKRLSSMGRNAFIGCSGILLVYNPSSFGLDNYAYFDEPLAIVDTAARAQVDYVTTGRGASFARVDGEWYFLSGLEYNNEYSVVPESFTANGETVNRFKLAKYSATVYGNLVIGTNVTSVPEKAISPNTVIFYKGTAADWRNVADLDNTVYYLKACLHEGDDGYWRYGDNNLPTFMYTQFDENSWSIVKAPTCTEEGEDETTCPHCNKTFTRTTGKIAHNIKDGKCTACGMTAIAVNADNVAGMTAVTIAYSGFVVDKDGTIRSGNKSHNSKSTFTVSATTNCDITFEFFVSSELDDYFRITLNGSELGAYSGETGRHSFSLHLNAGDVLELSYTKDGSVTGGNDGVNVNNFTVIYAERSNDNA